MDLLAYMPIVHMSEVAVEGRFSGAGVVYRGCELPDVGAGDQAWVITKSRRYT